MSEKPPDQMTLVFLRSTRQVLAAATRAAVPGIAVPTGSEKDEEKAKNEAAELKVLVGEQLLVRQLPTIIAPLPDFISDGIAFPVADLRALTTELKLPVLSNSRLYFIDADNKVQLGADPALITVTPTTTAKVDVVLTTPVVDDTELLILVYEQNSSQPLLILQHTIKKTSLPPNNQKCSIPVLLNSATTYDFMTFVQGFAPRVYRAATP